MIYDAVGAQVIMIGGVTEGGGFSTANDTWVYDTGADTWSELHPKGSVPSALGPAVYDQASGRVIHFGGITASAYNDNTWAYDPAANTWSNLNPAGSVPSERTWHVMAYDPTSGRVILFGGYSHQADLNDTWAYDPVANTWTELHPAGSVPPGRQDPSMVYDPATGKMILFGGAKMVPGAGKFENGRFNPFGHFNDTWTYDPAANTWTELQPTASAP